jgi:acetyl esterase
MRGVIVMPVNPKYEQFLQQDFDRLYEMGVDKIRQVYLK